MSIAMAEQVAEILSHWYHLTEGLQFSSKAFYTAVEQAVERRKLPDVQRLADRPS